MTVRLDDSLDPHRGVSHVEVAASLGGQGGTVKRARSQRIVPCNRLEAAGRFSVALREQSITVDRLNYPNHVYSKMMLTLTRPM
jgi:hypothetical protein